MGRIEYEDLLESTQNLGDVNEMGEDDTENKTRGIPKGDETGTKDRFDAVAEFLEKATADEITQLERHFTEVPPDEINQWRETLLTMAEQDDNVLTEMYEYIEEINPVFADYKKREEPTEGCKRKKKRESKIVMEQDDEGVDFIPGITAGEDLAMGIQETLDSWLNEMAGRYGSEKMEELTSNPDFKDTVIENVTTMMTSLGTSKPNPKSVAVDEEPPIESKEANEELSPSPADRAEGLVNMDDLNHLKTQIRDIGIDLAQEGFDSAVTKEVVCNATDEALLGLDDEEV